MSYLLTFSFFILISIAQSQFNFDRFYLPPKDFSGPRPHNPNFNFLIPPITQKPPEGFQFQAPLCNPPPVNELVLHSSWAPIKKGDTLYPIIRYSNRTARTQFVGTNKCGKPIKEVSRVSSGQECVTFQWNSLGNEVRIYSYDGCELQNYISRCEQLDPQRFLVRCAFSSGATITQNIVKTDGQIWMLGYECWTNPDGSQAPSTWSVYSVYNTLPESLREEILNYVRTLGFDPADNREPTYENCPAIPNLHPELKTYPDTRNVRPPPQVCDPPSNLLPVSSWQPAKKDDILYLPIVFAQNSEAVDAGYIRPAEQATCSHNTGGGLKRRKQCLGVKYDTETLRTKFQYFDGCETHILDEQCRGLVAGHIAATCDVPEGGEMQLYGVLGDNHTYILFYECWTTRSRKPVTWSLRSVSKSIPESLKQLVLSEVERLGFDVGDYREPDYKNCPNYD